MGFRSRCSGRHSTTTFRFESAECSTSITAPAASTRARAGHSGIGVAVNDAIDRALGVRNRAQPPRHYVSTSGLGRECLRQIQYDYLAVPKDEGREFEPKTLRIFEAGHRCEDIVAAWLRAAGFDLRTERADGRQFGFSALDGRFKGHIDGCLVAGPVDMAISRAVGDQGARRRALERRRQARRGARQADLCGADRALSGLSRSAASGALHRAQSRHLRAALRAGRHSMPRWRSG